MTKRKTKPVLLGPDGQPYVAPEPKAVEQTPRSYIMDELHIWGMPITSVQFEITMATVKAEESLASKVARQVDALTRDLAGTTIPEMPKPPADLHTYADALASAMRNCPHESLEDTIHSRGEYLCLDCRRYLSADDIRAARDRQAPSWRRW